MASFVFLNQQLCSLASKSLCSQVSKVFLPPSRQCWDDRTYYAGFYVVPEDRAQGLVVWWASTLPAELHPNPGS